MQKNFDNFSMEEIMRLANSNAGQQLLALLQSSHSDAATAAIDKAQSGDMSNAKAALQEFLSNPQAQALIRQIQEDKHG